MSLLQNNMMAAAASVTAAAAAYTIDNSCRFNDNDSAHMIFNTGTATDSNRWTFSTWFKIGNISGTYRSLLAAYSAANDAGFLVLRLDTSDYTFKIGGWNTTWRVTTQLFRDPSAWYHLVVAVNTDESGDDMIKVYLNGTQVTAFTTKNNPTSGTNIGVNTDTDHYVGSSTSGSAIRFWDGYMSEVHFVDGEQLAVTEFGKTNDNGVWIPKEYSGTYGNNGWFLNFKSSGDLGNDVSGNNNDFTTSGLVAADQMTDTPTLNYCTWNSIDPDVSPGTTPFSDGNLVFAANTGSNFSVRRGTFFFDAANSHHYFEITATAVPGQGMEIGIQKDILPSASGYLSSSGAGGYGYASISGKRVSEGANSAYGDTYTNGDVIGVRIDNGSLFFYKNGTIQNSGTAAYTGITGFYAAAGNHANNTGGTCTLTLNAGQSSTLTLPTGATELSSTGISAPDVTDPSAQFQTELYTGDGVAIGSGGQAITLSGNSSMQPDFVWIKNRDATDSYGLYDSVRGTTKQIESDDTSAETTETEGLTTFGSDGFTVGSLAQVNTNTEDYVSWNWKEGATPGFDIVTYTGDGANRTISHNLGVVSKMILVKNRSAADAWKVYHAGVASDAQTDYLVLNTTAALVDDATVWNDTAPTSSVFSVGTHTDVNTNTETYVAYVFAEVEGFSKFGYYTGTGNADGPFVYCGSKPNWVLIKNTGAATAWTIWDIARDTYNQAETYLLPNSTAAEATGLDIDILSNGFKIRGTDSGINTSNGNYVFAAFAENPFGGSGIAPATAH